MSSPEFLLLGCFLSSGHQEAVQLVIHYPVFIRNILCFFDENRSMTNLQLHQCE